VALLLILLALFGFVFAGIGSGSSGTSALPAHASSSATARSCSTVVSTVNGKTVRKHSCSTTSGGGTTVHSRVIVKCSVQMTNRTTKSRCPPPAKP